MRFGNCDRCEFGLAGFLIDKPNHRRLQGCCKHHLDEAIEWQKKAVGQNQGNRSIDATLKKYEAEKALQASDSSAPAEGDPANGDEQ